MAPKAAPKGKGPKGKEIIMNRKMEKPDKMKDARERTQKMLAERAIRKMQRYARMKRALAAMEAIRILEDVVLLAPTPGEEALRLILAGPSDEIPEEGTDGETSPQSGTTRSDTAAKPDNAEGSEADSQSQASSDSDGPTRLTEQVFTERLREWGVEEWSAEIPYVEDYAMSIKQVLGRDMKATDVFENAQGETLTSEELELLEADDLQKAFPIKVEKEAERIAKLIFWILDAQTDVRRPELTAYELERVCRHHRKRRRNANAKVHLFLALVQHGDAEQSYSTRSPTSGSLPKDAARPMTPEGWNQVTRTAWALRLCPTWMPPGNILTAESQCSLDTTERIRLVGEGVEQPPSTAPTDVGLRRSSSAGCLGLAMRKSVLQPGQSQFGTRQSQFGPPGGSRASSKSRPAKPFPQAHICDALDFPRPSSLLGPVNYYVGEAISSIIKASENPKRKPKLKPKEVGPTLLVAGGAMLETLLACLTSGSPREQVVTARLRGGDAVLLRSYALNQIVGEDANERWRLNSNLWHEAMKRNDWTVLQHIRGDGRKLPIELGGIPTPRKEVPAEFKTRLTAQWNRYAGTALVVTDREYLNFRKRAGFDKSSGLGLTAEMSKTFRPLTKDYIYTDPPAWHDVGSEELPPTDHPPSRPRRSSVSRGSVRGSVRGRGTIAA